MSGYKHATVTISQEEYRRLHEADMKKRFKEYASLREENSNQVVDAQALIEQMEDRQRQLEEALHSIGQETNWVEAESMQDILLQNRMCYEGLAAAITESTSGFYDSMDLISDRISQELQSERENYRENLESLLTQQESLQKKEYAREEAAQQWMNRCLILADFIQDQYDHERFTPGRLNRVLRNLDLAEGNLIDGSTESGLQTCQQNYLELADLHFELEQNAVQWQTEYERTYLGLYSIINELNANATVNALDLQGEELPIKVNLDFWTNGKYFQLTNHCQKYLEFLVQDQQSLTLDDLNRIYSQVLPSIRGHFEAIVYEARIRALNSQLRMNIAEKALHALEEQGFKLEGAGYSDSDMRAPFNAMLDSADGTEVVIQVLPTESSMDEFSNELIMRTTHPYLKTEHEARLQWEELSRTLHQYNLRVSRPDFQPSIPANLTEQAKHSYTSDQTVIRLER